MPFPLLVAAATSNMTASTTNHNVKLPPFRTWDVVVIYAAMGGNVSVSTEPTGWTQLYNTSGGSITIYATYRVIDGTEGYTGDGTDIVTYVTATGQFSDHITHTYRGSSPFDTPTTSTVASGTDTTPNPGQAAPGSADDYLWVVHATMQAGSNVTAYPANYTIGQLQNGRVTVAARQLNAATQNPPAWTISASVAWHADTLAMWPRNISGGWGQVII